MTDPIRQLEALCPDRPLTAVEVVQVAERQATRLLRLMGVTEPPVPNEVVTELPGVQVDRLYELPDGGRMPVSGTVLWSQGRWVIVTNRGEPVVRQRFSMCHELHHVVMHARYQTALVGTPLLSPAAQREQAANLFAAALLMPRSWVKRDWGRGLQDEAQLARAYDVSLQAMRTRLLQLGLTQPIPRCDVAVA